MKGIIVKKSGISGKGVFANKDFKKGSVVLKWNTRNLLSAYQVASLPRKEREYASYYSKGKYLLFKSPERYVNHSCDPNTRTSKNADIAIKNIKKVEEITTDYGTTAIGSNFTCRCNTSKCKKIIKRKSIKELVF